MLKQKSESYGVYAGESEMAVKPTKIEEYQLDLNKIWELDESKRDTVLQLIKLLTSNGDYENREIIKNTLRNYGIIITKREDSLNKLL